MQVKEIMTQNVVTISSNESISKASELMRQYDIGILPVVDEGKVVGVITDRDIVTRAVALKKSEDMSVCDCMSKSCVCANPTQEVSTAAKTMAAQQVRRVPVMENGCLCGILSLGDISRCSSSCDCETASTLCEISKP